MSSAAASTRVPVRVPAPPLPLSTRGAWLRLSMVASLALLSLLPWVTTTGCDGKAPPTTWTGYDLLQHSAHNDPVFLLGPALLVVAALACFALGRVQTPRRRFIAQLAAFLAGTAGVSLTFLSYAVPTAADIETHHAAGAAGVAVLLAFFADCTGRMILGGREWWLARRRASR